MNNIKIVKQSKQKPEVLIVTPLSPGHKISSETKATIQRNDIPFVWVSSEGKSNIPTNALLAKNWYKQQFDLPKYYLMIDRDITLGRHMIDKLVGKLSKAKERIAYAYASFSFKGYVNHDFPARPFDLNALLQHNYISSNSLFRSSVIEKVEFVTDDKYKRLLDWAYLLKLFDNGYYGIPCPEASFTAKSTQNDISAGSPEDYHEKRRRVLHDFGMPILDKYHRAMKIKEQMHQTATHIDF